MTGTENILGVETETLIKLLNGVLKKGTKKIYNEIVNKLRKTFETYSPVYNAQLREALFKIAERQNIEADQLGNNRSLSISHPMDIRLLRKGKRSSNFQKLNDIYDFWHDYEKEKKSRTGADKFLAKCDPMDLEKTLEMIKQLGGWRSLIHAPGGFGKTSFLLSLTELAIRDKKILPVFFDLAKNHRYTGKLTKEEFVKAYSIGLPLNWTAFLNILAFADTMDRTALIVIDSVNQESRFSWDEIRDCIEALYCPYGEEDQQRERPIPISILICDRMKERIFDNLDCDITTIAPLSQEFIKNRISNKVDLKETGSHTGWFDILDTPLFLGLAEKSILNKESPGRAGLIENYILETVKIRTGKNLTPIPEEKIDTNLGKAAYHFYQEERHTEIDVKSFKRLLGSTKLFSALETAGVISLRNEKKPSQTLVSFFHQTIHDYLAARYLVGIEPREARYKWSSQAFDVISLNQSSYDSLELAAEHISRQPNKTKKNELSNAFVRQAYNWSISGTLKIISRLHHLGREDILSKPLLWALYAVNMERKFDPFQRTFDETSQFFEEILPLNARQAWKKTGDPHALIDFIEVHPAFKSIGETEKKYWARWIALFTRKGVKTEINDLLYLSADPLLGWTSSNVFRRKGCEPLDQVLKVAQLLYKTSRADAEQDGAGAIFRWRLVHMLGRCTKNNTIEFLLEVACDNGNEKMLPEYPMTRYGALRSYLEVSTLDQNFGQRLKDLARSIGRVLEGELHHRIRIKKFLENAPHFREPPDGWNNSYQCVLEAIKENNNQV